MIPVKSLDEILQISLCYETENSIRNSIMQFFLYIVNRIILIYIDRI